MKLKWTSLTPEQEKKNAAILLIVIGLWCLLKGPERLAAWHTPEVVYAPSFGRLGTQLMIAGGVMLIAGVAMAWHIWWKRKPS
jgi:hypothetical protein